ncbi:PHD finger protein 20-like isoform X2 [Stegostoma tigrinum]|uniref:PHD finger protein 20-like isoform X2 n=1 Tax=Stegostoma tigrinum TaxID=3053191 RepID=UPI0028701563|nr:PHD finger protein 20-like isoform X2 [Stegostoma tigrinum]
MSKKPPSRRGITFEVGARLEARDRLKKWYTAHIEKIDYEEGKVLIHFKRWNHRYDEWFSWDSVYLRPLERPLLRKEGAKLDEPVVEFRPSEQVLACWSDCRFYPAKVISVNKDASYTVEFYDGVVQTVKKIHVKSLPKTSRDKNSASGRNKENGPGSARQRERLRERAPPSLGDERVKEIKAVEKKEEEAKPAPPEVEPKPSHDASAEQAEHLKSSPEALSQKSSPSSSEPGKPEEKRKRGRPPSVGLTGSHSKGAACQKDRKPLPSHQGGSGTGKRKSATDVPFQPKHTRLSKTSGPRQPASDQGQIQTRRRSLRLASGDSNSSSMGGQSEGAETRSKTKGQEKVEQAAGSEPSVQVQQPPSVKALCSSDTGSKASTPEAVASPKHQASEVAKLDSPAPTSELKGPPKETAPVVKRVPRSQNPNRYMTSSTPNPENHLPPKALVIELDHNKFKCKIPECSKAFRKAKMLHYHMKYYHGMEKAEPDPSSPKRSMQTRGSCASEGESLMDSPKRRRTTSGSIPWSQQASHRALQSSGAELRAPRLNEKRRIATLSSLDIAAQSRLSLRDKSKDSQTERSHQKLQDREKGCAEGGSRERSNEKKLRDFLKVKLKKKKKKKKKSKSEFSGSEENVDVSRDFPPKRSTFPSTRSSSSYKYPFSHKYTSLRSSDSGYYMEGLKFDDISDDDPTSDSSTDSLLWSEDEYNQDVDVTTNPDETGDGDDSQSEIVRCVCEVEEENEFMIQCEDCLCWQHGVCMGLLEDSVPETYTCYICRDPPDQRLSSRYWYDKEWLSSGHMHGLTFLKENYSHQNSGKIVSTHQLLGDVHKLIKVLHGLQLKIYILQNKDQPDLKLWCKPWRISSTAFEKLRERQSAPSEDSNSGASASTPCRAQNGTAEQQNRAPMIEESYITNEHCYQKPRAYYPAAEQRLVVETRNSALDEGIGRMRENGDETLAERFGRNFDDDSGKPDLEVRREQASSCKVRGSSGDTSPEAEAEKESRELKQGENEGSSDPQLQWQVNLLTHVESLQDEVCHRMDFIEKELDVLESWLDYSGELEPPDPLTRLPQLKHRMKQLLTDLGKVQQIASCCPV